MSPVQRKPPPVQVKEPYGYLDMVVGFHPATLSVQSTSADSPKRVWQYISRKKEYCTGFTVGCTSVLLKC